MNLAKGYLNMRNVKSYSGLKASLKGLVIFGSVVGIAACQSGGSGVPLTPGQAQAAFYDCLDNSLDRNVRSGGGDRAVAARFLNRCHSELAEWEDALVANGMPPADADARISGIREQLIEELSDSLSGPI